MTQLAQRLRLDLPDPLARHLEVLTDLFERVIGALADPEAQLEHLLLARRERRQHLARVLGEVVAHDRLLRADRGLVLDEVPEMAVLFLADRRLEADRLLRDL